MMDMNEYALEIIARDRQAEMREFIQGLDRARAAKPVSRPVRIVLGEALIAIGRRLQGSNDSSVMRREMKPDANCAVVTRRRSVSGPARA